jgi:hypothetical protein
MFAAALAAQTSAAGEFIKALAACTVGLIADTAAGAALVGEDAPVAYIIPASATATPAGTSQGAFASAQAHPTTSGPTHKPVGSA